MKCNTPELSFLLAKWGSAVPYRRAAALLGELLPISDNAVSQSTVRQPVPSGRASPRNS
ncbi:MAG: hypothetical protein ABI145_16400 [Steroidobacteraceae bacterium]